MNDKIKQRDFLYSLYIEQNKSRKEICSEINCSENTLKYYLKKYKLIKDINKILENTEKTNLKKYGHKSFFSSEDFKKKSSETWIMKYGVDNPSKSKEIKEKQQKTFINHIEENSKFKEEIKQKKINTNRIKYGKDYFVLTDEYKKYYKDKEWLQNKRNKEIKTKLKNNSYGKSKEENKIFELIKQKYPNIQRQYKSKLYPFECDFYIPELDLYIEYQGFWMHGEEPYIGTSVQKEKIKLWESKGTIQYLRAINTWTIRDPLKREIAKENRLNYLEFFSFSDFMNWMNK